MANGCACGAVEILMCVRALRRMLHQIAQRAHAAHRIAEQAGETIDAEMAHEFVRGVGDVFERQIRKSQFVYFTGARIDGCRSRRSFATAERVHADHEPAVRVDVLARSDHVFPPAGRRIVRVRCSMRIGRQSGEDEDCVVARGRQRSPRFIRDFRADECAAAAHRERRGQIEKARGACHAVVGSVGRTLIIGYGSASNPLANRRSPCASYAPMSTAAPKRRTYDIPRAS